MRIFIHKKPHKIAILNSMVSFIVFLFLIWVFRSMTDREGVTVVVLAALVTSLFILFIKSLLAPFLSGVTMEDGRIEEITPAGGVVAIKIDEIDLEKSVLDLGGLRVVSRSGQSICVTPLEYSWENILRVAEYAKITDGSWKLA